MSQNPITGQGGPIRYEGLGEEVTARLREAILSGRLLDGERIVERDVSAELGVSRGPIRDALKQLEHEGLVVMLPRRGARVASLTAGDASEVLAIRSALEPAAVESLLTSDNQTAIAQLKDCLGRLKAAGNDSDWAALVSLDMEFHEIVFQQAGRRFARIWELLRVPLLQTFRIHREFYDSARSVFRSHRALLDAIESGDIDRAKRAVQEHVVELKPQLLERLGGDESEEAAQAPTDAG